VFARDTPLLVCHSVTLGAHERDSDDHCGYPQFVIHAQMARCHC
jgi:hypothetical protein